MILMIWKQIINQKKKYFILWLQLFIMFFILFFGNINLVRHINNLIKGVGCETDNVQFLALSDTLSNKAFKKEQMFRLRDELSRNPKIESVSLNCNASPFIGSCMSSGITYNDYESEAFIRMVDENFHDVLNFNMIEGKWFEASDTSNIIAPAIICEKLADDLFNGESAIGKVVTFEDAEFRISGVISHLRRDDYEYNRNTILIPVTRSEWLDWDRTAFIFKLKPNSVLGPKELKKIVHNMVSISHFNITDSAFLNQKREKQNQYYRGASNTIFLGVGFMVFNIVLGLIGIVSYSVNGRISELGIRRAIGSSKKQLLKLVFSEMFAIAFVSLICAIILLLNIHMLSDELDELFTETVIINSICLLIFVSLSATYPAIKASRTEPALALKED